MSNQQNNQLFIINNLHLFQETSKGVYGVNLRGDRPSVKFVPFDIFEKSKMYGAIVNSSPKAKMVMETSEDEKVIAVLFFGKDGANPCILSFPLI